MRPLVVALALALTAAVAVSAQTYWSMTQWFQHTIATQAARLDLTANNVAAPIRGYLDQAWVAQNPTTWENELHVMGWGFECGQIDLSAVDIRINGFVRDATSIISRGPRGDVVADPGLNAWCPTGFPVYSGFDITVPLGILPSTYGVRLKGWTDDGQHFETNTVWLWID